mmetsp:Transcript_49252/g.141348  ORF Transcript_49252/g.141348 Transcript_49252/m.141348 type:complete len:233 (+) Transcript_49252:1964-2662(+)
MLGQQMLQDFPLPSGEANCGSKRLLGEELTPCIHDRNAHLHTAHRCEVLGREAGEGLTVHTSSEQGPPFLVVDVVRTLALLDRSLSQQSRSETHESTLGCQQSSDKVVDLGRWHHVAFVGDQEAGRRCQEARTDGTSCKGIDGTILPDAVVVLCAAVRLGPCGNALHRAPPLGKHPVVRGEDNFGITEMMGVLMNSCLEGANAPNFKQFSRPLPHTFPAQAHHHNATRPILV